MTKMENAFNGVKKSNPMLLLMHSSECMFIFPLPFLSLSYNEAPSICLISRVAGWLNFTTRPFDSTGQVLDELHRKRGKHSYRLRWSLYYDLQSCSTRSFTLFLRAMKAHILRVLENTYHSGKSRARVFRVELMTLFNGSFCYGEADLFGYSGILQEKSRLQSWADSPQRT